VQGATMKVVGVVKIAGRGWGGENPAHPNAQVIANAGIQTPTPAPPTQPYPEIGQDYGAAQRVSITTGFKLQQNWLPFTGT
jgi:hypothetical protein